MLNVESSRFEGWGLFFGGLDGEGAGGAGEGVVKFVDGGSGFDLGGGARGGGEESDGAGGDSDEGVEPLAPTGGGGGFFVGGGGEAGGSGMEVRFNL